VPLHGKLVELSASQLGGTPTSDLGDFSFEDAASSQENRRLQYEGSFLPSGEQESERSWSALLEKDPLFAVEPNPAAEQGSKPVEAMNASLAPAETSLPSQQLTPPPLGPVQFTGHFETSVGALVEAIDQTSLWASAGSELKVRAKLDDVVVEQKAPESMVALVEPPSGAPATERLGPGREVGSRNRLARAQRREKKRLSVSLPKQGSAAPSQLPPVSENETLRDEVEPLVPIVSVRRRANTIPMIVGVSALLLGLLSWARFVRQDGLKGNEEQLVVEPIASTMGVPAASTGTRSSALPVSVSAPARQDSPTTASAMTRPTPPALRFPASNGLLWVEAPSPGRVFVQGIDAGPTSAFLEVSCGLRNVRVAQVNPPPPGQSFPDWLGEAESVVIPCGRAHHVELPRPRAQ
jgi:hypothetical protein